MLNKKQEFRKRLIKYWGFTEQENEHALHPSLENLNKTPPPNTRSFVKRIIKASENQEKIIIFGDNDLDGCMSSGILLDCLKAFNCEAEIIFAKHHHNDGPGIRKKHIDGKLENVKIIITIDCSVRDEDVIKELDKLNIDLWTIDHHPYLFGIKEQCVNSTFTGNHFKHYCAAGLAFRISLEFQKIKKNTKQIENHLVGCMLATIADSVKLRGDNRTIVICGIEKWFKTDLPVFKLLNFEDRKNISKNLFTIRKKAVSPLNSPPRYDDPHLTVSSLFCKRSKKAEEITRKIKKYNKKRIEESKKMFKKTNNQKIKKNCINVFYEKKFSPIYVSQIAGRISFEEKTPSIVFAESDEGCLRGSARSPDGCEIRDLVINGLKDIAIDIGGHPQAFGLTIKKDDFEKAKKIIETIPISFNTKNKEFLSLNGLPYEDALKIMNEYEPYGSGFRKPTIHE
mgnify:CR=1 FL=1